MRLSMQHVHIVDRMVRAPNGESCPFSSTFDPLHSISIPAHAFVMADEDERIKAEKLAAAKKRVQSGNTDSVKQTLTLLYR